MPSCALMYLRTAVGQLLGRRRRVLRDRNAAERRQHLGEHGAIERNAGDGKAGRGRRMRVHDRLHVGPLPVDLEVHQHLGRGIAIALQLASLEIGDAHHVRRHEPLADALRGHQQAVGAEPDADVAVVRRGVAARVHAAADFDDVGAERGFGAHAVRGPILVAAGGRAEVDTRSRPSTSVSARSGSDERAAHRIAHHLHAARRHLALPRGGRPLTPSTMPSTSRQNARATKMIRTMKSTSAAASRTGLLCADAGGCAERQAVERALRRLAFRAVGRDLRRPAARPASAPSRSCLPNALHDADVQQRLGVLGIELQRVIELRRAPCPAGSCSSSDTPRSVLTLTSFGASFSASPYHLIASSYRSASK